MSRRDEKAKAEAAVGTMADNPAGLVRKLRRLLAKDAGSASESVIPLPIAQQVIGMMTIAPRKRGRTARVRVDVLLNEIKADNRQFWLVTHGLDHPFLTDTLLLNLKKHGLDPQAIYHPVINVTRSSDGHGTSYISDITQATRTNPTELESLVLVLLDRSPSSEALADVKNGVNAAADAVGDFPAMIAALNTSITELNDRLNDEEKAFLEWMADGHLIMLGCRRYSYERHGRSTSVKLIAGSGLGILGNETRSQAVAAIPLASAGLAHMLDEPGTVVISKTPDRSVVHRDAAMDVVSLLERDKHGRVCGEIRFVGLWASRAYTRHVMDIPLVRETIKWVEQNTRFPLGGMRARMLVNVLETWPRDELFLTPRETLKELAEAVVTLRERPDVALLLRRGLREHGVTVLLYVPMSRYTPTVRARVLARLSERLGGTIQDYRLELGHGQGEGNMARLMVRLHLSDAEMAFDQPALEQEFRQMLRGWEDDIKALDALLWERYGRLTSVGYRDVTSATRAIADFHALEKGIPLEICCDDNGCGLPEHPEVTLRLFSNQGGYALFQLVPLLDTCGLAVTREHEFELGENSPIKIQVLHALPLQHVRGFQARELETMLTRALQAPSDIGSMAEADELNKFVILGGLDARKINWLRLLTAYIQQVDRGFEPNRTRALLLANPELAIGLTHLFDVRLNPHINPELRTKETASIQANIEQLVRALPTNAQEKLARTLLQTVLATLRTNAWRPDVFTAGGDLPLVIKLDPSQIDALPQPKPWREMFVFHPAVEGIHLRGGPVARGGLRHSDRATDYRTEVLGLMAAQVRKNTIIVPTGAKGGFYITQPMPDNKDQMAAVIERNYKRYVKALLSVTDTFAASGHVIGPSNVLRSDGDDPYLVVAADKGTARFSDTANQQALDADFWPGINGGFWLGDAFASGGSHGYDHKAMGITSRGAWISVKHHLRALDITPSAQRPLVMTGIGDMAGDVFGNGLLRDEHVQLIAAFNHKHIFLDPDPNPAESYAERLRCFNEGLGWDGYDSSKISAGGGVFLRSVKKISLSPRMQERLGLVGDKACASATPEDVMTAILQAPVDVLWNGGIGTFIKASDESHEQAADRANDAIRVDADSVRAKIIGEGGNLGITPKGRVALALHGVRLNSDALDNSAGVSTSDHEVNVKILLKQAMDLATHNSESKAANNLSFSQRNSLLKSVTSEIAAKVLADNRLQNMAITLEQHGQANDSIDMLNWQQELLNYGVIDRAVDTLPTAEQLNQRHPSSYTRPELCALLAGTKTVIRQRLLTDEHQALLTSAMALPLLKEYFPATLANRFEELLPYHRLSREIVATALANELVNRLGILFWPRLAGDFGATLDDAIKAASLACTMMQARCLWQAIDNAAEAKNAALPLSGEVAALLLVRQTATGLAAIILRQGLPVDLIRGFEELTPAVIHAAELLPEALSASAKDERIKYAHEWQNRGFSKPVAERLSLLSPLAAIPDAVILAKELNLAVPTVLAVHLGVGEHLRLPTLIRHLRVLTPSDKWARQATQAMVQELFVRQKRITTDLLRHKNKPNMVLQAWQKTRTAALTRYHSLLDELLAQPDLNVAMMSVLVGRLRELD